MKRRKKEKGIENEENGDKAFQPPTDWQVGERWLVLPADAQVADVAAFAAERKRRDDDEAGWHLGDAVLFLEAQGCAAPYDVVAGSGWKVPTLRTARSVARRIRLEARKYDLPYGTYSMAAMTVSGCPHEAAAATAESEAAKAEWDKRLAGWLEMAVAEELSGDALRLRIIAAQGGGARVLHTHLGRTGKALGALLEFAGGISASAVAGERDALEAVYRTCEEQAAQVGREMQRLLGTKAPVAVRPRSSSLGIWVRAGQLAAAFLLAVSGAVAFYSTYLAEAHLPRHVAWVPMTAGVAGAKPSAPAVQRQRWTAEQIPSPVTITPIDEDSPAPSAYAVVDELRLVPVQPISFITVQP